MTELDKILFLLNKDWKCFVITFCGRSGSYFLHSILDGHKDVLALPPWCTTIYSEFVDTKRNRYREKLHVNSVDSVFDDAITYLANLERCLEAWDLNGLGASVPFPMFGKNQDIEYRYDLNILKKNLHTVMSVATRNGNTLLRKDVYLSFFIAYGMTIGISLDEMMQKTTLLYQMHTFQVAQLELMNKDFPKLKHLIAAKNPVRGLLSHIQLNHAGHRNFYWHMGSIRNSFESGIIQPFMNSQNTIAIKIDLLNMYGVEYVKSILSHLEMEWDDICAESTVNGKTFWWRKVGINNVSIFTGFNKKDNDSVCSIDTASCEDKILLSHIFKQRSDAWGYKTCPAEKIGTLGHVLYKNFECIQRIGFSKEESHALSQGIWDCYLNLMESDVTYPPTIPFEHVEDRPCRM